MSTQAHRIIIITIIFIVVGTTVETIYYSGDTYIPYINSYVR